MQNDNLRHAGMPSTQENLSATIRNMAQAHGFALCRITRPEIADKHRKSLDDWVKNGMHGDMAWMAEDERMSRRKLPENMLKGVQTVISLGMRYLPPAYSLTEANTAQGRGVISSYAQGDDYHDYMKKRLKAFARDLDTVLGKHNQRVYVDTAPVLEHALAEDAGIGWQGKHSLSIDRQFGSWFFLGEIFTSASLQPDAPATHHCGSCSACIDVCPTRAIVAPFVVDARLCISYLTIEHKGIIPRKLRPLMGNRIYGCDDCQLVCPWNNEVALPENDYLEVRKENILPELVSLLALDEADFREFFRKSPVKRIGRARFIRNCCVAAGNSNQETLLPSLLALLDDDSPLVRGHAVWAVGRLEKRENIVLLNELQCRKNTENDIEVHEDIRITIRLLEENV